MSQASPVSSEGRLTAGRSLPLYQEALLGVKSQALLWLNGKPENTWQGPGQCNRCPQAHKR